MVVLHGSMAMLALLVIAATLYGARLRQGGPGGTAKLAALVFLALAVLSGVQMWVNGQRPSGAFLSGLHLLLGAGALVHAALAVRSRDGTVSSGQLVRAGILAFGAFLIGHFG